VFWNDMGSFFGHMTVYLDILQIKKSPGIVWLRPLTPKKIAFFRNMSMEVTKNYNSNQQ
jgi:uncharacterized lipoprotein YddW (UPF0748 family)